jgi:hypothetical protein
VATGATAQYRQQTRRSRSPRRHRREHFADRAWDCQADCDLCVSVHPSGQHAQSIAGTTPTQAMRKTAKSRRTR